ncbi:MAG: CbtB-domain containing protein [Rhodospirillaceae bacterium]|nr:CbtB-domain containing protein [Rhodospirillaceae bacterium]
MTDQNNHVKAITHEQAATEKTTAVAAALFAALFGAFLVFGAGFANSATLHNAAHDSRHSMSFPCH